MFSRARTLWIHHLVVSGPGYANYLFQLLHTHFLIFSLVVVKRLLHMASGRSKKKPLSTLAWSPIIISASTSWQSKAQSANCEEAAVLLSAASIVLSQETTSERKEKKSSLVSNNLCFSEIWVILHGLWIAQSCARQRGSSFCYPGLHYLWIFIPGMQ